MAHTFVTKSQLNGQTGTPITHNHTPSANATLCVLSIVIGGIKVRSGGAPTIGGVVATQVNTTRRPAEESIEMWYVVGSFPSSTPIAISVPNSGADTCHLEVVTADAGTGFTSALNNGNGFVSTSTANGGSVSVTSSASGDFLYCRLGCGENLNTDIAETSANPTKTQTYTNDHGTYCSVGNYAISDGAGSETFTYTWSSDDGGMVAGAWKSVSTSGPSNMKTYNTNTRSNIKSINTNPIANVKTLNTNA